MSILRSVILSILVLCVAFTVLAQTRTASTTTLTATPSDTIVAGQIITLTAAVSTASGPVTGGAVSFYDGKLYLGSVQIVRNSAHGYSVGTATMKRAFSTGSHTVFAIYASTAGFSQSTSASQTITVAGTGPTSLVLSSTPGTNNYTLNDALTLYGVAKPSGSVFFIDQTTNVPLGTVAANPSNFTRGFSSHRQTSNGDLVVDTADLNGDGIPDLLLHSNPDARGVEILSSLGNGDGTFQTELYAAAPISPGGGLGPVQNTSTTIGDYNGDGVPDFAFVTYSPLSVVIGKGDGSFQNAVNYHVGVSGQVFQFIANGDFNGDGILDLLVADTASNTFLILLGNADATFAVPLMTPSPAGVTSLLVQDFNLDGSADLAVTVSGQNTVLILLGNGDGTFQPPISYPAGGAPVIGAALQSRGGVNTDLAILNKSDNTLGILLGKGDGTFLPQATYPVSAQAAQVVAADLTGDGLQDIAVLNSADINSATYEGSITVFPGNGDGTYQTSSQYDAGSVPTALASADFNGDGISDLIATDRGNFTLDILLSSQQGNVSLTTPVIGTGSQQLASQYLSDPNYNTSVSNSIVVQGQASPPSFTASLSPGTMTITAGGTGTATLTLTPQNGFNQAVQFNCSGLPANATCSFSPATVTPNGAPASTTLTISVNPKSAAVVLPGDRLSSTFLSLSFLFGFGGFAGSLVWRRRHRQSPVLRKLPLLCQALMLAGTVALGCGHSTPATSSSTSSVTVTASTVGQTGGPSATSTLTIVITN